MGRAPKVCTGMTHFRRSHSIFEIAKKKGNLGVVDRPCVIGVKPIRITMRVVPGEVQCLLSRGWLKQNGAIIDTQTWAAEADETGHRHVDVSR